MAELGRQGADRLGRGVVVALAVALVLTGCSSDDDPEPAAAGGSSDGSTAVQDGETDGGTIHETVTTGEKPVLDPVAMDAVGDFGNGVTTRLTRIEDREVEGHLPGEISGPGVAITVELVNGTSAAIDLDAVLVDLVDADGAFATLIMSPDDEPLAGQLPAGESSQGTYVFTIAEDARSDVSVQVTYSAPEPTVIFEGSLDDV